MSPQPQEVPLPVRIRQMREFIIAVAYYIAITLTPVLRVKPGFNVLQPGAAFVMTAVMMLFNALMNFHLALPMIGRFGARQSSDGLWYYALLFLGFALWNRRARFKALVAGERWHTYSPGVSRLAALLPVRQDLVYRIGEPVAAYLTGAVLRKLGINGLGLWFEIASVCVYLVENYAHERALERDLAILDSLLESEVTAATADHFTAQEEGQARSRPLSESGGIATGADPGLEAAIARRRKEAAGGGA
jgi:hypothetical protein